MSAIVAPRGDSTRVSRGQRFTRDNACPVCCGSDDDRRGTGTRCFGFLSDDGDWAHCTREEFAGALERKPNSDTFAHKLSGECGCGRVHGPHDEPPKFDWWSFSETYDYVDEDGELRIQVCRYKDPKTFRQRRPTVPNPDPEDDNHWIWNLDDVDLIIYRQQEFLERLARDSSALAWIVEGEKDVDCAMDVLGIAATTSPMGAKKWRDEYSKHFRDRHSVIVADNDDEGREHARMVARSLRGIAASVRVLTPPGVARKGDLSDWVEQGGTREQLLELARKTPLWRASKGKDIYELLDREFPPLRQIIPGLLVEGSAIFGGRTKMGKSRAAAGIAVAVATGGRAFGSIPVEQGWVLFLGLEDSERRLQDRFRRLLEGSQTHALLEYHTEWARLDEGGVEDIEEWIIEHPGARLIVVDILEKVRPHRKGRNGYGEDYEAPDGLTRLAGKYHLAVLIIHHLNQRGDTLDPMDLLSGTEGLPGNVDTAWILKRTRGEADAKLHVYGRDVLDQQKALKYDSLLGTWSLMGDAEEYELSKERRGILGALQDAPPMGPTEVAGILGRDVGPVKKLMHQMGKDGQLKVCDRGEYAIPGDLGNFGNLRDADPADEEEEGYLGNQSNRLLSDEEGVL